MSGIGGASIQKHKFFKKILKIRKVIAIYPSSASKYRPVAPQIAITFLIFNIFSKNLCFWIAKNLSFRLILILYFLILSNDF